MIRRRRLTLSCVVRKKLRIFFALAVRVAKMEKAGDLKSRCVRWARKRSVSGWGICEYDVAEIFSPCAAVVYFVPGVVYFVTAFPCARKLHVSTISAADLPVILIRYRRVDMPCRVSSL